MRHRRVSLGLYACYVPVQGYHSNGTLRRTPLKPAKIQRISLCWPAVRQAKAENHRMDKRVESCLVRCLDGGSSPPISTTSIDFQLVTSSVHEFVHENTSFRCVFSICNPIRKPFVIFPVYKRSRGNKPGFRHCTVAQLHGSQQCFAKIAFFQETILRTPERTFLM